MSRAMAVVALTVCALGLVGCGPSKCEQAGGTQEVDYYMPITTVISTGKTMVPVTTMTPVYKCVMPEGD